jgi:hypothetical protein
VSDGILEYVRPVLPGLSSLCFLLFQLHGSGLAAEMFQYQFKLRALNFPQHLDLSIVGGAVSDGFACGHEGQGIPPPARNQFRFEAGIPGNLQQA